MGITQEELSFKAKITPSFLSHIERGTKKASLESIERIAAALGVGLDKLFQEKSDRRVYPSEKEALFARRIEMLVKDRNEEYKKVLLRVAKLLASRK